MHNVEKNIVFYDGDCLLCSRSVRLLMRLDRRNVLRFSLLHGDCIKKIAPPEIIEHSESILFWDGTNLTRTSSAIIGIMKAINMPKALIWLIEISPHRFRDYIYNLIARNRYTWFGKTKECFFPQGEEAQRFIP